MVSVRSVVVACVALIALTLPTAAPANTIGPACGNMMAGETSAQFFLLFHTDPSSSTTATVVGVARFPGGAPVDAPVSGAALLYDPPGFVSMGLTVAPSPGRGPLFVNVPFLLSTLHGEGHCTGGPATCGDGRDIIWVSISCTEPENLEREGQRR